MTKYERDQINQFGKKEQNIWQHGKTKQAWLYKAWHWAIWADKADGMFWNILEGFYQRVFPGQVDRFNKVGTYFTCKIRLFK